MNEEVFSRLHYHSGLVAQGCWDELDEYDREAIRRFGELIVKECISTVEGIEPGYRDYRDQIEDAFRRDCVAEIKHKFGVE